MSNSIRRNTAFDLTKLEFVKPQNRFDANRWLMAATFGPGTAETDLTLTTSKTNIIPRADCQDDAEVLMDIGYEAYVDQQLSMPVDYMRQVYQTDRDQFNDSFNSARQNINPYGANDAPEYNAVFKAWWAEALHSPAQIRHKLAYALSQIFVVDEGEGAGRGTYDSATYYDILLKATESTNTSSYLQLIEDITYHPMMARMLTYKDNRRFNPTTGARPDENYARELLQLFSIGLKQLNMDGTVRLDENGAEMETYAPEDITNLASVFTGMNDERRVGAPTYQSYIGEVFYEDRHELGEKILFSYPDSEPVIIPAFSYEAKPIDGKPQHGGFIVENVTENTFQVKQAVVRAEGRTNIKVWYSTNSDLTNRQNVLMDLTNGSEYVTIKHTAHGLSNGDRIYSYSSMQESIKITLEHVFNHPCVPPFMAKSLIKFFVTSNPSPQYIERVAWKFVDNGNGVRGDLSAVIKAVLLDREAIIPYGINPVVHGRSCTIVDRLLRVGRAFKNDLIHVAGKVNRNGATLALNPPIRDVWPFDVVPRIFTKPDFHLQYAACSIPITRSLQVMRSPSVFNFYRPNYVPPGSEIGDVGKTAPELQMNTVGEQIDWMWQVCALAETERSFFKLNYGDIDPVGHEIDTYGMDFDTTVDTVFPILSVSSTSAFTVAQDRTTIVTDDSQFNKPNTAMKRVSDGAYAFSSYVKSPNSVEVPGANEYFSGAQYTSTFQVGDELIMEPLWVIPRSGLGHRNSRTARSLNFMFYHIENLLPETSGESTDSDLDAVIDYMEQRLMPRPISETLRARMRAAGKLPATAQPRGFAEQHDDLYRNFRMTSSQKKIRRMIGLLLVSPEFTLQN